jgi:hypothetical protein
MSHYIIKLTSGETVYGMISEPTKGTMVVVKDPLVWEEYETEDGGGTALVRYIAGTDEEDIPINKNCIVSMAGMSEEFKDFYDAAVGIQKETNGAYSKKIASMAERMKHYLMDMQAKRHSIDTDDIVAWQTDNTIH